MRYALIAAGTNSCRLLIVRQNGRELEPEHHDIRGTRLGEGIASSGVLAPEAIERTLAVVAEFAQLGKQTDGLFVIGTSALRDARNAAAFTMPAEEITGTQLHILTGAQEAVASFNGAVWALERDVADEGDVAQGLAPPPAITVADVGGGSTEIASRASSKAPVAVGQLALGAVGLTERFFKHDPPLNTEIEACRVAIRLAFDSLDPALEPRGALVVVGGTADAAARVLNAYDMGAPVRVATLRMEDLADLTRLTISLTTENRKRLQGLPEERADIFPAGLMIVEDVARLAGVREFVVTEADLLIGYLKEVLAS